MSKLQRDESGNNRFVNAFRANVSYPHPIRRRFFPPGYPADRLNVARMGPPRICRAPRLWEVAAAYSYFRRDVLSL